MMTTKVASIRAARSRREARVKGIREELLAIARQLTEDDRAELLAAAQRLRAPRSARAVVTWLGGTRET